MRARNYYRRRSSPWPRWICMALLAAVLVYALAQLIGYGVQMHQERALRDELTGLLTVQEDQALPQARATEAPVPSAQPEPAPTASTLRSAVEAADVSAKDLIRPEVLMTYHALWERNNDLVGWLNIRALPQVDLPVVQRDHTYYLRRDFDGRSNMNGTAFMDTSCRIWPRTDNLIIYAHNMKSGEMFGALHKLMHEPFYRENPLATFNTIYERAAYVPVAVVLCTLERGEAFFNFSVSDFRNEAAFNAYIADARRLSTVHPPYDVRYGDDLLTLVTCYDEAHEQRLIILLRRVRADEDPEQLTEMWK